MFCTRRLAFNLLGYSEALTLACLGDLNTQVKQNFADLLDHFFLMISCVHNRPAFSFYEWLQKVLLMLSIFEVLLHDLADLLCVFSQVRRDVLNGQHVSKDLDIRFSTHGTKVITA